MALSSILDSFTAGSGSGGGGGGSWGASTTTPTTEEATPVAPVNPTKNVVDATDIGTESIDVDSAAPVSNFDQQLAQIEAQALSIQKNLNEMAESEQGAIPGVPTAGGGSGIRDEVLSQYFQEIAGGFDLSDDARGLQTDAAEAKLRLDNLSTQLIQYNKETRDEEYRMRQNQEGKLRSALDADIANYKYERYARPGGAADMAIEAQFALNRAEFAYEIAENAVSAEKDAYNTRITGLSNLYNMLQNDMTDSEQMVFQTRLRMFETQANNLTDAKLEAMKLAQMNGAPEDVVLGIKNAQTPEEVLQASGQWGTVDMLDQAYKKTRNAIAAAEYQELMAELQGVGEDLTLTEDERKDIAKMPEAKKVNVLLSLNANMSRLAQLYETHGTWNPIDRKAKKEIQSLRSQMEIDLAVAGGQGAISEQEADRYKNIIGGKFFESGKGAKARVDAAIKTNDQKIMDNIKYVESVYPEATAFGPFKAYLNQKTVDDYVTGYFEEGGQDSIGSWLDSL